MPNIHPFDRATEFPNYFELMLNSVPEGQRDAFVKTIQKLIEQNISAIVKRLKLYYVNDNGELSTADYFNELVKSMERALQESPAKDDYNLEVYLSGGVVRALLGYAYKQLYINIQAILEKEFQDSLDGKQKKTLLEILEAGQGEVKSAIEGLEKLLKTSPEPSDSEKKRIQEKISLLQQRLKNLPAIDKEQKAAFDFLRGVTKTPEFWLQKLKTQQERIQSSYVLGVGSDMDILYNLKRRKPENESKITQEEKEEKEEKEEIEKLEKAIQKAGEAFLDSARGLLELDGVAGELKDNLLPKGDVKEYKKQTEYSMSQGGSTLDWLAFELSSTERRKLIEPPSDLKQKVNLTQSIVENFIRGYYEYFESQIEEDEESRAIRTIRVLRSLFQIPFVTLKNEDSILKQIKNMLELKARDSSGKIVLPQQALAQLRKLQRNTDLQGAANRGTRPDPESAVLSKFSEITREFASEEVDSDRKILYLPKYVHSDKLVDKILAIGKYQSEIDSLLLDTKTFIAESTNAGTLYHGTPLETVPAIIRGGFYISDSIQGRAKFGSGLYTTKDREVALEYSQSILTLHIDTDRVIRVINLEKLRVMNPELLEKLAKEAKEKGFLDSNGASELNELLKTQYRVDIIINEHIIIQNAAVIKPIILSDMTEIYGLEFEKRFTESITIDNQLYQLLTKDIVNFRPVNRFFNHYISLCFLSGAVENNRFSPLGIIKNLVENIKRIEKMQKNVDLYNNTNLFIYKHCFLAPSDYVIVHLTNIFKRSNDYCDDNDTTKAFIKFAHIFSAGFNKNKKENQSNLVKILKNLILYANTNDLIVGVLENLKPIGSKALNEALSTLISSGQLTQTQALYFLTKIDNKESQKNYSTFFGLGEFESRIGELSKIRKLPMSKIYEQYPNEIFENLSIQNANGSIGLQYVCSYGTDQDIREILMLNKNLKFLDSAEKSVLQEKLQGCNIAALILDEQYEYLKKISEFIGEEEYIKLVKSDAVNILCTILENEKITAEFLETVGIQKKQLIEKYGIEAAQRMLSKVLGPQGRIENSGAKSILEKFPAEPPHIRAQVFFGTFLKFGIDKKFLVEQFKRYAEILGPAKTLKWLQEHPEAWISAMRNDNELSDLLLSCFKTAEFAGSFESQQNLYLYLQNQKKVCEETREYSGLKISFGKNYEELVYIVTRRYIDAVLELKRFEEVKNVLANKSMSEIESYLANTTLDKFGELLQFVRTEESSSRFLNILLASNIGKNYLKTLEAPLSASSQETTAQAIKPAVPDIKHFEEYSTNPDDFFFDNPFSVSADASGDFGDWEENTAFPERALVQEEDGFGAEEDGFGSAEPVTPLSNESDTEDRPKIVENEAQNLILTFKFSPLGHKVVDTKKEKDTDTTDPVFNPKKPNALES